MLFSNIIPIRGFLAVNLFGVVVVRKDEWDECGWKQRQEVIRHEAIHTAQGRELLWIGFYLAYLLEWLWRLVFHTRTAYSGISFEREAYDNQGDPDYLKHRKHFAQWK